MSAKKAAEALLRNDPKLANLATLRKQMSHFGAGDETVIKHVRDHVMNTWTLTMVSEAVGCTEQQVIAALLHLEPLRIGTTCVCRGRAAQLFS